MLSQQAAANDFEFIRLYLHRVFATIGYTVLESLLESREVEDGAEIVFRFRVRR